MATHSTQIQHESNFMNFHSREKSTILAELLIHFRTNNPQKILRNFDIFQQNLWRRLYIKQHQ